MRKIVFALCSLLVILTSCERSSVNLIMSPDYLRLQVGHSARLNVTMLSDTLQGDLISWTTSNPEVVMISDGVVTGLAGGTAVVTAKAMNASVSARIDVEPTEEDVPVEAFLMKPASLNLAVGQSDTLVATYLTGERVEHAAWHTTNTLIVYVDQNGVVTALREGSAIISAVLMEENKKYVGSCTVTVSATK